MIRSKHLASAVLVFGLTTYSGWALDGMSHNFGPRPSTHPTHSTHPSHSGTPSSGGHHPGSGGNHSGSGGNPYPLSGGNEPWPHWHKPGFVPPAYNWDWVNLQSVTCVAQNANGEAYPVVENGYLGTALEARLPEVEQAALDRCYAETEGDASCALTACVPTYS